MEYRFNSALILAANSFVFISSSSEEEEGPPEVVAGLGTPPPWPWPPWEEVEPAEEEAEEAPEGMRERPPRTPWTPWLKGPMEEISTEPPFVVIMWGWRERDGELASLPQTQVNSLHPLSVCPFLTIFKKMLHEMILPSLNPEQVFVQVFMPILTFWLSILIRYEHIYFYMKRLWVLKNVSICKDHPYFHPTKAIYDYNQTV